MDLLVLRADDRGRARVRAVINMDMIASTNTRKRTALLEGAAGTGRTGSDEARRTRQGRRGRSGPGRGSIASIRIAGSDPIARLNPEVVAG